MKKAILSTKVGMTQIFNEDGTLVPVTVLQAGPCVVTQVKTVENDGYSAVQIGFVDKKDKIVSKDANGKKEIRKRLKKAILKKPEFPASGMSESLNLRMPKITNRQMKLKLISLLQAIKLTLPQSRREKGSRVRLSGMDSTGGR